MEQALKESIEKEKARILEMGKTNKRTRIPRPTQVSPIRAQISPVVAQIPSIRAQISPVRTQVVPSNASVRMTLAKVDSGIQRIG